MSGSVCLFTFFSKSDMSKFTKSSVDVTMAMGLSSSDDNAIRYVLPVSLHDVTFAHNRRGKGDANKALPRILDSPEQHGIPADST